MPPIAALASSVTMLAVFALTAGGLNLLLRHRNRKQGVLMLTAAAVLLANVLIWTLPG